MGESGSGKTTAIQSLDPKSTFIIQVEDKDLPFRGGKYVHVEAGGPPAKNNLTVAEKFASIMKTLNYISSNREDIKTVIIDDFQYMLVNEFMGRINEKSFIRGRC